MAGHFKLHYAAIMQKQLTYNMATTQLNLALPDSKIIDLLKEVQMLPDDTDNKQSVVPDLFDSWAHVASKVAQAWGLRARSLVDAEHGTEWFEEMKIWGRVSSTIDTWTLHRNNYSDLIRRLNELGAMVDARRPRLSDFLIHGGASHRRKSARLRQRRQ